MVKDRKCVSVSVVLVRTGTLVLLTLFSCLVAASADDNTAESGPGHPYSGQTAADVQRDNANESESDRVGRTGTPSLPGAGAVFKMLMWVLVVVAFIYAAVYLVRKYMPSARNMFGSGVIKIVGRTYISSKQYILLVKVGAKFVMVGVTGTAMTPLAEIADAEEANAVRQQLGAQGGESIADSFKKALSHSDEEYAYAESGRREGDGSESELSEISRELETVTEKMNWWRRHSSA